MIILTVWNFWNNFRLFLQIPQKSKRKLADTGMKFQKIVASKYNYSYMPVCFRDIRENVAFDIANRVLCLPLYADLEIKVVGNIINIIKSI